jgi:hypothetical protein
MRKARRAISVLQRLEKRQVPQAPLLLCLIAIAAWPRTATYNDNDAEDGDSDNDKGLARRRWEVEVTPMMLYRGGYPWDPDTYCLPCADCW